MIKNFARLRFWHLVVPVFSKNAQPTMKQQRYQNNESQCYSS
jgi:hypothetical protein